MMQRLTILNTRDIKSIKEQLRAQFGYAFEEEYVYLRNEKNRLFLTTRDMANVNLDALRVDRIGLYVAELSDNEVRLSKEGAQLLVEDARKGKKEVQNCLSLSKEEVEQYFLGQDIPRDLGREARFVILLHGRDVLGCAKYKEGKILNFHPKIHRANVIM